VSTSCDCIDIIVLNEWSNGKVEKLGSITDLKVRFDVNSIQKRQFTNHRATEQLRNQTVTSTTDITKKVNDFSGFNPNSSLFYSVALLLCVSNALFSFKDTPARMVSAGVSG